jgi:hypothetical protein
VAKLPLPQSDRARVFRKVVALLRTDPILKRTIRPASWYVWDGRPDQKAGVFASGELPALRITPRALPATPETVTRQSSPMGLAVELATDGTDIDDAMNLWAAVEAVLFPGDGSLKLFFYSWGSVFDVSPLLMGRESRQSLNHSATHYGFLP